MSRRKNISLFSLACLSGALALGGPDVFVSYALADTKSGDSPTTEREKFDPARDPKADLQAAIVRAQKQNKRIILDVGGEWCGWCREMDRFIARHANLLKLRDRNYVWVKVNYSDDNSNRQFLSAYPPAAGYPHIFVLDKNGKLLLSKNTEELEDGKDSYNLQKFTEFLTRYAPKKARAK